MNAASILNICAVALVLDRRRVRVPAVAVAMALARRVGKERVLLCARPQRTRCRGDAPPRNEA